MDAKRICPYCMQELDTPEPVCPHCGRSLTGRNPSGSLPVGTVLAGRYTVGEIQSIDGEGILYRGVENKGRFRVTIKEYMPLTLAANARPTQVRRSPVATAPGDRPVAGRSGAKPCRTQPWTHLS